jgi:hypothetical protein
MDHLAGLGADRQGLVALAHDFAGMATDAILGILEQVVLTHSHILLKTSWKAEYGARRHLAMSLILFLWERLSASMIAAGKPLSQKNTVTPIRFP